MGKILRIFIFIIFIALIPFILLIRLSIWFHVEFQYAAYVSIVAAIFAVASLLFIYFSFIHTFITGRFGDYSGLKRRYIIALLFVFLYTGQALFFISGSNVKSKELASEFQSLHPILRLGTSTLTLLDKKLILTDAERAPEDYRKMGLPTKGNSLHYPQSDGYVYALDLRVKSRSEFRNALVKLYYKLMGFKTLRHVGTADHLHISLYNHERPGAI